MNSQRSFNALLLLVAIAVVGCGDGDDGTPPPSGGKRGAGGSRAGSKDCNDLVELALSSLRPEQFGTIDDSGALTLLDGWKSDFQSDETARIGEAMVGEETRRILPEDWLARVTSEEFNDQDALHVRTVIQMRATAEAAAERADDELGRVVDVFDFVMRNVQLVSEDDSLGGLSSFETLIQGEGTARDRAAVFIDLLRQLRIDAVVLEPVVAKSEAEAKPETKAEADGEAKADGEGDETAEAESAEDRAAQPFLVGVLVGGKCYLFDPRLGWPIPSPEDDGSEPFVTRPATLAEVRAEGELLERLDLPDEPYPLDDADLDDVRVLVSATSSLLAPRLAGVHAILTGDTVVDSFDATEGALGYQSILERLHESAPWSKGHVGLWTYPEKTSRLDLDAMPSGRRGDVLARREVLTTPLKGGVRLLDGRLQQLRGEFGSSDVETGAISNLAKVRDRTEQTSDTHVEGARDALFWTALCTLASGDGLAAGNTFRSYLDKFPDGRFARTCRFLRAEGYARGGSLDRAVTELEALPDDAPDRVGIALWKRRWSKPTGDAPEKPTDDPPVDGEANGTDDEDA